MKGLAADPSACSLPHKGLTQVHGDHAGAGLRIGLVISRFNDPLTVPLGTSCVDSLVSQGVALSDIHVAWVPGAFEIPTVLEAFARSGRFDALIALGVVLEGATSHAQAISREVSHAITAIARERGIPVIDGVICANAWEQAEQRACSGEKSRGWYAADAAVEMAVLMKRLASGPAAQKVSP